MITFTCDCGNVLNVDESLAGKKGKCLACGSDIVVPKKIKPIVDPDTFVDWTKKKAYAFVAGALVVGIVGGYVVGYESARYQVRQVFLKAYQTMPASLRQPSVSNEATPTPTVKNGITKEQLGKIHQGMSYDAVLLELGPWSEQGMYSASDTFGEYASYKWKGIPNGTASISFRDGYVSDRSWIQF